jgi:hypothetical protein
MALQRGGLQHVSLCPARFTTQQVGRGLIHSYPNPADAASPKDRPTLHSHHREPDQHGCPPQAAQQPAQQRARGVCAVQHLELRCPAASLCQCLAASQAGVSCQVLCHQSHHLLLAELSAALEGVDEGACAAAAAAAAVSWAACGGGGGSSADGVLQVGVGRMQGLVRCYAIGWYSWGQLLLGAPRCSNAPCVDLEACVPDG